MTWREIFPLALFFAACAGAGVAIGWFSGPFGGERGKAGVACDRWVETLLTSDKLTEVTRAGIIVREMPCNILKRVLEK
jgi:hypothetical protein